LVTGARTDATQAPSIPPTIEEIKRINAVAFSPGLKAGESRRDAITEDNRKKAKKVGMLSIQKRTFRFGDI
jgi:hypothetical protein